MKQTLLKVTWLLIKLYVVLSLVLLYGVAMGFVPADSNDMLSQSLRAIYSYLF